LKNEESFNRNNLQLPELSPQQEFSRLTCTHC